MPIPAHLHRFLANEVRMNIDQYWNIMASIMMGLSVIDYIVPANTVYEGGNSSRVVSIYIFFNGFYLNNITL